MGGTRRCVHDPGRSPPGGPVRRALQRRALGACVSARAPRLETRIVGSATVGSKLALRVRLRPARAGAVRIRIGSTSRTVRGATTIPLGTVRPRTYRILVSTLPAAGFTRARSVLTVPVVEPRIAYGSRGPGVRVLEQTLAAQHYALQRVDGVYGEDTVEAVLAFQKVHGLERTGRVDPALWHAIEHAHPPAARYPGDDIRPSRPIRRGTAASACRCGSP